MRITVALTLLLTLVAAALPAHAGKAGEVRVRSFELLNEGVSAYNRGDFAGASEKLEASASMALNSFRAHFYLGLSRIGERRYREAMEALLVALDLDPKHLQASVAFGDAQLKIGDLEEARAAYYRAIKLRPAHAPALDGVARTYEAQARDDKAIEFYRKAILSDQGFAAAYTHLGDLYLRQERVEEALRLLEEAITIRPDYAPGLNRLALAYGRIGLRNEAAAMIRRAMELEPGNGAHPATLGWIQLAQGEILRGDASFRAALELDAALPEARQGLAEVARRRGLYEMALQELQAALDDARLDAPTRRRLQGYRAEVESEAAQVAELEGAVAESRATPEQYGALAALYAGRGDWERALELQSQSADGPVRQERLAYLMFRARRYRESQALYAALGRQAGAGDMQVNSGVALARLGDDDAAIETFRGVLEAQPQHLLARLYLANALLRSDLRGAAAEAYKRFLDDGGSGESAERVRRILRQIAPELLPPEPDSPVPGETPQAPAADAAEEPTS